MGWQPVETDYVRNYYWLRPGYGIVAQLNSVQASSVPANNFDQATAFIRMFDTNKKPVAGCTQPGQVTDLSIAINNGKVLLKWSKTQCTSQYRVEYSNSTFAAGAWKTLSTLTNQVYLLDDTSHDARRFYRVVSIQ